MSRFGVWLLCCAIVLITIAFMGSTVNIRILLGMFAYLGAPLMLHWGLSSEEGIKDVKEQK